MQNDAHSVPVYLGFASEWEATELFRLKSHFLPLGKIGGWPAWLNPKNIPQSSELECKVCNKGMCFLMQVYATGNNDPEHSFHRTLFLFVCRNPACSRVNDPSNMAVFRCGLPRHNPYYSPDGPMDPDLDGDVPDPRYPADAPQHCRICGCYASKKCARCGDAWYCSRDHQALDWGTGHKTACGQLKPDGAEADQKLKNPKNLFVFKEFGIDLDQEYVPGDVFDGLSDDDSGDEEMDAEDMEEAEQEKKRLAEFKKFVKEQGQKHGDITAEDCDAALAEAEADKDPAFDKFNRLVRLNPDQVIRYMRAGEPLPATDKAPPLVTPPPCERCGAARQFEMQVTPHVLSLIEVDQVGQSIDWASVYVYTCSASCAIPDSGYTNEFLVKHDFV